MPDPIDDAMDVPADGAVVRMYCTGLGDCFLLGFPDRSGDPVFMMIDCGVLLGTDDAKPWMRRIMNSIVEATGDRGLDVLVATHKHWDHLSGFKQAEDEFRRLEVKRVWMGWTESPTDPNARRLAAQEERALHAIRAAALGLRSFDTDLSDSLRELLAFNFGADGDILLGARTSTNDLMELVRSRDDDPLYLTPSLEPRQLNGVPGVNVYVLGPPTDLGFMRKSDPSKGDASEVYLDANNELSAIAAAADSCRQSPMTKEERKTFEFSFPFEFDYGTTTKDLVKAKAGRVEPEVLEFYRRYYGLADDEGEPWRRIDDSWLRVVEQLAIDFDNYRNNTSLVLAIELGAGGPVMLFPGDAQVGSWLSWHELEGSPSAEDLLDRTVLYKVGHHASHNATLKAKGLEMMTRRSQLVAMIPVDEQIAHTPKGRSQDGWDMPYGDLLRDLEKRTEGRVMRSDLGVELLGGRKPPGWSAAKWKSFNDQTIVARDEATDRPFFVQYTVRDY